ncbi:MAG TPA: restriction endonuclease subunit S [Bacteroidales bacterium]|nr:restriction endonuclease subunit S [Bacteroidales bacterium]
MSKEKLIPEFRFPEFKDSGEWDVKTLGEVLIKNSKKNKNQKYSQVESVSNKFGFIKQDEYFKNRRVASKDTSNYYVIKKGYFAYNPSRIDVGSLAYKHNDEISIISPLYVSFKANNELINDYFLLSFFNSVTFTKQMIFEGGVRNTLNYDNLIQSKIPIPTIQEQQRIASCLSSLDEVIEAHSKKLELLKDHKKGLMQNLFPQDGEKVPKLRFKEFENSGEWEEKKISDLGETISGLTGKSKDDFGAGKPFVTYKQVFDNSEINFEQCERVQISDDENQTSLQQGDILFTTSSETPNEVGFASVLIDFPKEKTYLNSFCFALRPFNIEKTQPQFSRYLFHSPIYRRSVTAIAQGSTRYNISKGAFVEIQVPIPAPTEQQKIASCLSALDELITAQQEKIDELQQHKKGLMQGLFPKIND